MGQHTNTPSSSFPWKELLTLLGVVITAYIGYLGIRSQTELPIQATITAEARKTTVPQIISTTPSGNSNETIPTLTVTNTFIPTSTYTDTPASTFTPSHTPTKTHTPTNTPDLVKPPAPVIVTPNFENISKDSNGTVWYEIHCTSDKMKVILDWQPVYDPSGISEYYVEFYTVVDNKWELTLGWVPEREDEASVNSLTNCNGRYSWRVQAIDGAGNEGLWSDFVYLYLKK